MFNPNAAKGEKAQKAAKKKALADIKNWSLSMIPMDLQIGTKIRRMNNFKGF